MAKGHLTIRDIPQDVRSRGAERLRSKLRDLLSNPFLPEDQRKVLESKLSEVANWEKGNHRSEPVAPPASLAAPSALEPGPRNALVQLPRQPQHHSISLTEDLSVEEK
jgi:hypothetical protein